MEVVLGRGLWGKLDGSYAFLCLRCLCVYRGVEQFAGMGGIRNDTPRSALMAWHGTTGCSFSSPIGDLLSNAPLG